MAKSSWSVPCYPVPEGEAHGLWLAIQWTRDLGLQNVIFELDCKSVLDSVLCPRVDVSDFGIIVKDCTRLISFFSKF